MKDTITQKTFSVEVLKNSEAYKKWINQDKVVLVHDIYHNDPVDYATYIVIIKDEGRYLITRFFMVGDKVNLSVDYSDVSAETIFKLLLTKYSSGVK